MSSNTDISENYVMIGLDNGLSLGGGGGGGGGHFKNTQELLNLKALKFYQLNQMHTFQCMSKIFCVELQRKPMKFHKFLHLRAHKCFWYPPPVQYWAIL